MGRDEQGQALVEFALVVVLFVGLISGLVDLARLGATYVVMANAAREGARTAALGGGDGEVLAVVQRAGDMLDQSRLQVDVQPEPSARLRGVALEVSLSYSVDLVMPLTSAILPNPFPLQTSTVMRME